ncbi:MAG: hypothetical protein E7488_01825 [Ruminococcaceae bacterium]|nr:hypothetical protein [Oscillospiraceae bacterium]
MANNYDVDKILQNIKSKNPQGTQKPAGSVSPDRLSQIIAQETAKTQGSVSKTEVKTTADSETKTQPAAASKTVTADKSRQNTSHDIENEFFSQLATALKENPAVADLVEEVPPHLDEKEDKNKVTVTAASYVDEKFVDFFTQSIAVPKPEPKHKTSEIVVKRRKFGLFKNRYITDSLSLSIPQEEIDRRQQKVAKPSTQELAKDFISQAAREVKPFTGEIPVQKPAAVKEKAAPAAEAVKPAEKAAVKSARKGDTKEVVLPDDKAAVQTAEAKGAAQDTAAQTKDFSWLPEAKNDSVILYYDDGKPAPKPDTKAAPKTDRPMDAESILQALKNKKTVTAHIVAEKSEDTTAETVAVQAVKAETSDRYSAEKVAEYYSAKPYDEAPLDNTGYIPSVATSEEKEIRVLPKAEEDSAVKAITGDITQLFAKTGMAEEEKQDSVKPEDLAAGDDAEEEVFEEFTDEDDYIISQFSDDPAEIFDELKNFKFTLSVRVALSVVCSVVLLYMSLGASVGLPLPDFINPLAQPLMFYLANLVFFAIVLIGFLPTVANGITGFIGMPTKDSFMVMPAVLCFAQINVAIFTHSTINPETSTLFAGVASLAFGLNALGKYINANTILRNLSLADVPEGINAGYVVKDAEDVKRLARSLEEKNPQILVSRRTGYISNFISGGFSNHSSERHCRTLSLVSMAVALICGIIAFVLTKDASRAVFAATGASVLMLPLGHALISSVPSSLMQKALNKVGALVNGWQGIYQLSDTTHVSFDAKHLFPKGCVVLHGIKTFEKERLDLAILYAASIAIEHCDNLRPVFMNVIDGKKDMLYPIENCEYKVGQGYVAWIENNRVIMGNRSIMQEYNIALPPLSMETQYISENKKPVYLSVNGKLFGMFVVSYHADEAVKDNLLHLVEQGKCVILQSSDFSIDSGLLEQVYDLPRDTVQVLNKNETSLLLGYTAYAESTDSAMAHLDSLHSLSAGFFGADSAKRAAATCSLVQIISIVVGAALSVMFTFSQTIWEIPVTSVLLLAFGWLGLCLMRAVATKYL